MTHEDEISLREHLELQIKHLEKQIDIAIEAKRKEFETKLELVTQTRRDNIALGLSLLGIILAIIAIIIKV